MNSEQILDYVVTPHAELEMKRRGINRNAVESIIKNPEQRINVRKGRIVLQSRISMDVPEKTYLVRVFVDMDRFPAEVITVYKTSKISKYWKE